MQKEKSIYEVLSSVNVEQFVKGKNGFKFLSWSHAVAQLLKHYPNAEWKIREWDSKPYLKTDAGCFVEVSVIIDGVSRSQLHPVLDFRNKPVKDPDAFQVNTSLQRALTKAISLHGMGLYIYQGEDIPLSEKEAIEESRREMIQLLKENDNYNDASHKYMMSLNYDQLQEKIKEYRK